ncbi:phosphodiesterase [Hathewaya histolytica]|uniref:phosphodiesterase n=1 Tax=Hathewaya histolytica TaxID=1498 RepID=UPI003B67E79D
MKIMFISDIHGSLYFLNKALERFEEEKADYIGILGDVLYHGPRNDLPKEYNPKDVAKILNRYKNKIIAVRGNCDSEVDQMLIDYPMLSDYSIIFFNNKKIFLTHGHIFNKDNMPHFNIGDIMISGHTHIPTIEHIDGVTFINPGSISIPKGGSENSYGILNEDGFSIKNLNGEVILTLNI